MSATVIASHARRCVFTALLKDASGNPITLDVGDVLILYVGKAGEAAKFTIRDNQPTNNGSSMTHSNPTTVTFVEGDLDPDSIEAGVWELDFSVSDAQASFQRLLADVARLVLHPSSTSPP